jgi:hypothetical protein
MRIVRVSVIVLGLVVAALLGHFGISARAQGTPYLREFLILTTGSVSSGTDNYTFTFVRDKTTNACWVLVTMANSFSVVRGDQRDCATQ